MRAPRIALLFLPLAAHAEVPVDVYPECGEPDRPDLCPSDLGGEWSYLSYVPENAQASILPGLAHLAAGHSADRAWRTTTGRWEAAVAVADSGISWDETDLVNKIRLNTGELPLPQLSDGSEADDYDVDGNGLVNIEDYAEDPRLSIDAGASYASHLLDPSDLLAVFSDGIDGDGNGYVDDIAGWDFFNRDNDAGHEQFGNYGGHGTGVLEKVGAEAENGSKIGVCPNCSLIPLRVGDTFVTDGTRAGEAMVYAADAGAVAMTMAIGALSNPRETTEAARYAFEQGMTLVGAAGDENAYHHNFPAMLDEVIYTHSIRHNTGDENGAVESYFNTWNCNNYGMRLHSVAPSSACATGAVGATAGMVGLLHSAAWDQGIELHAGEVLQIFQATVDDIALTDAETAETKAYPSHEGWDGFYGYGRLNAAAAVEAVVAGEIPPWVTVSSPAWFQPFEQALVDEVIIEGVVSGERTESWEAVVQLGLGFDPLEWTEVTRFDGSGTLEGELARVPVAELDLVLPGEPDIEEGILERLDRVNQTAATVRIQVTDAEGRTGEVRKTFFVNPASAMLPGFPLALGASGESSPILSDLDGDGIYEIIIATADGFVHALDGGGEPLEGWPVRTEALHDGHPDAAAHASGAVPEFHDGFVATVAVGDLDADGSPEVVAAGLKGGLYAWHADGSLVDGFPAWAIGREPEEFGEDFAYDQGFLGAPTLVDLDGSGTLEIVLAGADARLYVFDHTATDWGPYPVEICHPLLCGRAGSRTINSVVVGDADGDGDLDFAFGSNEALEGKYSLAYLLDAETGSLHEGWPLEWAGLVNEAVLLPLIGEGHPASMAALDLDGDGDLEFSNPIMLGSPVVGSTDLIHHTGETALEIPVTYQDYGELHNAEDVPSSVQFVSQPAFGDLDGDGVTDFVHGGASTLYIASLAASTHMDFQNAIGAWSGVDGQYFEAWPRQIEDAQFLSAPAIADLDGDGLPEVIHGSAGYVLHAWDVNGESPEGWPKFSGGWMIGSPAVGDIDGDGYLDVVVSTREGYLFAWATEGPADVPPEWASIHHDPQNTGNYETPLPAQAGPPGSVVDGELQGCTGCARGTGAGETGAALLLLLGAGAGWRRRRS